MAEGERGRLAGKIALITGAASGFGEGIARRFADEGASVAVLDRNGSAVQAVARDIGSALALEADVSDGASVAAAMKRLLDQFGGIDILVNNAGIGQPPMPLEAMDEAQFDRLFAVNAKSVYLTARHAVAAMKQAGQGAILNIASTGAIRPRPGLTWYNASKGWMIAATRAMAIELAPAGIRVNAINPVAGETPLLSTFMGEDSPEGRERMVASIPLGRLSTPADMAGASVFLCSDEAAMITGVALEVDGGRCI
jgi:3-oxoacyl-[acyl-carrier protein] reductase